MSFDQDISGEYIGYLVDRKSHQVDSNISIVHLQGSVISLKLNYEKTQFKLTAVLKHIDGRDCLYLIEKYTQEYFIQGDVLHEQAYDAHGILDSGSGLLELRMKICPYNEKSCQFRFSGSRKTVTS